MTPDNNLMAVLWNRTIQCMRCGRVDMVTTETMEDAMSIVEGDGWFIHRRLDDCQAEGLCPHCREAVE